MSGMQILNSKISVIRTGFTLINLTDFKTGGAIFLDTLLFAGRCIEVYPAEAGSTYLHISDPPSGDTGVRYRYVPTRYRVKESPIEVLTLLSRFYQVDLTAVKELDHGDPVRLVIGILDNSDATYANALATEEAASAVEPQERLPLDELSRLRVVKEFFGSVRHDASLAAVYADVTAQIERFEQACKHGAPGSYSRSAAKGKSDVSSA